MMNYQRQKQASRVGKSSICIFVTPEKKAQIIAALASHGYGYNFQEGITNYLDALIESSKRRDSSLTIGSWAMRII